MFNSYAFGFVGVAAALVIGADYVVQSKANGANPGEYALASYVGNYSERIESTVAMFDRMKRQTEEARVHLPEAPEGWERRDWDATNAEADAILARLHLVEQMAFKDALKTAKRIARTDAWEYVQGGQSVRLAARFTGHSSEDKRITAMGVPLSGAYFGREGATYTPFAVVRGVPFFEVAGPEKEGGAALTVEAFLGPDIILGAATDGSPETLKAFLELVDYDNLNLMLDEPLAAIGSAAEPLGEAGKQALFTHAMAAHYGAGAALAALAPDASAGAQPVAATPAKPVTGTLKLNGGQALGQRDGIKRVTVGQSSANGPKRLELSGGRACLGGSGSLCD
ncbi:MAG: hypothetical protein RIG84_05750 [Roseovarius sp.]